MLNKLNRIIAKINKNFPGAFQEQEEIESLFFILGVLAAIGFAIYYLVWHDFSPQVYESSFLRIIAIILSLGLMLRKFWPTHFVRHLRLYWYLIIFYLMPFFFTLMLLKNNFSTAWTINAMTALFCLILVTGWLELIGILFAGIFLAVICYYVTTPVPYLPKGIVSSVLAYLSIAGVGGILIYRKEKVKSAKLQTMKALGSSIAHELRTPLSAIRAGMSFIKSGLSSLKASIPESSQQELSEALKNSQSEIQSADMIIDMLLMNIRDQKFEQEKFKILTMSDCVKEALARYPFSPADRAGIVRINAEQDFNFKGLREPFVFVLFNLLKNSLEYTLNIESAVIEIRLEKSEQFNRLYFRDTGKGIPAELLPKLFKPFVTGRRNGTGLGLYYCWRAMQGLQGNIRCDSVVGKFTQFVLEFPVVE